MLTATALNAEAGMHPVTQDPLELDAVKRASGRALEEFPYLVWRFGERGRRFTDSDGAWLVTLVRSPQAQVNREILWLGSILAHRGIPRLVLQRHLELLHDALCQRVPGAQAHYRKLLVAADLLAAMRRASVDDSDFERLGDAFDQRIGPDLRRRLPGVAAIVIGALVDDASGMAGALANVRDWFTEPGRFPEALCSAVRDLERDARRCLSIASNGQRG